MAENEIRLIDANALKIAFKCREMADIDMYGGCHIAECFQGYEANEIVDKMPTVDAVEVVHGHWCWEGRFRACSECGSYVEFTETLGASHWRYCPYCGANMDADAAEQPGERA